MKKVLEEQKNRIRQLIKGIINEDYYYTSKEHDDYWGDEPEEPTPDFTNWDLFKSKNNSMSEIGVSFNNAPDEVIDWDDFTPRAEGSTPYEIPDEMWNEFDNAGAFNITDKNELKLKFPELYDKVEKMISWKIQNDKFEPPYEDGWNNQFDGEPEEPPRDYEKEFGGMDLNEDVDLEIDNPSVDF